MTPIEICKLILEGNLRLARSHVSNMESDALMEFFRFADLVNSLANSEISFRSRNEPGFDQLLYQGDE